MTNFRNKNQDFFSEELERVLLDTTLKEIKNIYENVNLKCIKKKTNIYFFYDIYFFKFNSL